MVVTLQALDPIFVDFYLPQQSLAEIRMGQKAPVQVDTFRGRIFPAVISAISPKLDQASRMAQIRATIANPAHLLLPGMFATVTVDAGEARQAVTIPNAAVVYNPYGSTVFVLDHGHPPVVHQAVIKTGQTRGDQVEVLDGLKVGDVVVTAGQIKLHEGSAISVNNTVQPTNEAAPNPAEE